MKISLFETHIETNCLEKATAFYEQVLELEVALASSRGVRFYWIGEPGEHMLGVWETDVSPISVRHFAFQVDFEDLPKIIEKYSEKGVQFQNHFRETTNEPSVHCWMPSASIYFQDPDGNSLEFIAKLPGKSNPSGGIIPLSEWMRNNG
ncbi:VOC family protein [Risungbinella massiliensis]|uniref:VOC family protein n=1 Tax=Risungbinella massiliensis TaxID=1329796 RepID=UPI0005CC1B91|nr:VOC family protein [Risungbinella massiliensis]